MLSATGKQNSSFLLDGIKDLSVGKENYAWGEPCKKNISEVDSIDHNLLRLSAVLFISKGLLNLLR
jgi:hypothetical protein